jgi:hypothetical protein
MGIKNRICSHGVLLEMNREQIFPLRAGTIYGQVFGKRLCPVARG